MNKQRKQYYIDPAVQSGLVKRLLSYWMVSMIFITLPIALFKTVTDTDTMFYQHVADVYVTYWPILLMMLVFLPFAANDAIKFSNLFTGPIYRLRVVLKQFENGERMKPFKFRKNDFWHDIADRMNLVINRLNKLEDQVDVSAESTGENDLEEVATSN